MADSMNTLSTQLLVIGGGATGLGIAWDASLRGIKTVLIEKGDIGEGTSGRYHGLLHSGGRYVLSDPASARECARENLILRSIAAPAIEDCGGYFVSTPTDPIAYPDQWHAACTTADVLCEEIDTKELLQKEPLLNPRISRAFQVQDAALDSFDLAHLLLNGIRQAGGMVLLHHTVTAFQMGKDHIESVAILDSTTGKTQKIVADFVLNAAGPWAGQIAKLAKIQIPLALGKGSMLAMASRLTHAVVNRCKPPSDGDIIVPVGTVCIVGTTDARVDSPHDLTPESWEIDLLLAEGDILIPGISNHRVLRSWSGIRPLYAPEGETQVYDRTITRAHVTLDHRERDGIENIMSVFGGKLTTFRAMAEEAVDLVANRLGVVHRSSTFETALPAAERKIGYYLTQRLDAFDEHIYADDDMVICECEFVTSSQIRAALQTSTRPHLDDVRRKLRLGMGPCQAIFCGYRAAGQAAAMQSASPHLETDFLSERWRGLRPLSWGASLRQIEYLRRVSLELMAIDGASA